MADQKIYIFALAAQGEGISGSDRIFTEFARNWSKGNKVEIFVSGDGYKMCLRQGLSKSNIKYKRSLRSDDLQISNMRKWGNFGFVVGYIARIFIGVKIGLTLRLENDSSTVVYSASEFWMDSLPAVILKLRYSKIKWLAAWYQTAPNPVKGFTEDGKNARYRIYALIYYFMQFPIKPLIRRYANFVLVNNENEKRVFLEHAEKDQAIVVYGAVDLEQIRKWKAKNKGLPKIYDAVFQGRFHPQKGVMELIEIWKLVVGQKPNAKLVLIGDGPLRKNIEKKIKDLGLINNVLLKGYLFDGGEKYKIFSQSKIVVHPSFFDSGGIAAYEAMAFGLPCVGFNLSSYRNYFPSGMLKVRVGELKEFAGKILQLLSDKLLYTKVQKEAKSLISDSFSWKYRSRQILDQVLE